MLMTYDDFPKKDKKRARRRADKNRVIQKAKDIISRWYFGIDLEKKREWVEKNSHQLADNLKGCSCYMCSNERKKYGPPISEIRQAAKDGRDD